MPLWSLPFNRDTVLSIMAQDEAAAQQGTWATVRSLGLGCMRGWDARPGMMILIVVGQLLVYDYLADLLRA